jgi:myo-inositol-1(or 4)-monophosphatase
VNFAHGVPLCCISIAVKKDAAIVLGAIYNPMMDEFFFAEAGKGAFLNGEPISVSNKTDFNTAFLVTGFPYHYDEQTDPLRVFSKLIKRGLPIRRLGSAALDLCWVAFWEYFLNPWDLAAGLLLVREAGGMVTNFKGEQHIIFEPEMLASNGHIHPDLLNELNS